MGQVAGGMGAEEVASLGVVAAKQVLEGRAEGLVVVSMDLGVGEGMLGLVAVCMVLVGAVGLAEVGMAVQGTAVEGKTVARMAAHVVAKTAATTAASVAAKAVAKTAATMAATVAVSMAAVMAVMAVWHWRPTFVGGWLRHRAAPLDVGR